MFSRFLGIFLIGLVIKLMDDFLDQDLDHLKEDFNFTFIFGRAVLPYSLVALILALSFNFNESVSLFAASYLIGMACDRNERLPSYLLAWQEGIFIFIMSIFLTSLVDSLAAINLILLAQFIDDFLDYKSDLFLQKKNYIHIFGTFNSIILTIILLLLAFNFYPLKLVYFISALLSLYLFFWLISNVKGNYR